MQVTLSDSDLEAMPPELRRDLFRFLLRRGAGSKGTELAESAGAEPTRVVDGLAALSRRHAIDLVREASFRPEGRILLCVLKTLARHKGEKGATRSELAKAARLRTERVLERYLGTLERMVHKVTGNKALKLWRYIPAGRLFQIDPATRQGLRDVLEELSHAGEHEEVLWE